MKVSWPCGDVLRQRGEPIAKARLGGHDCAITPSRIAVVTPRSDASYQERD